MNPHWNREHVHVDVNKEPQLVAVYGSLKMGFNLHQRMDGANYIGHTMLKDYIMFDCGAFPAVMEAKGFRVMAEVYRTDWNKVLELDRVEGVPNFYQRTKVKTYRGDCWVYTRWFSDTELLRLKWYPFGVWNGPSPEGKNYTAIPWRSWQEAREIAGTTNRETVAQWRERQQYVAKKLRSEGRDVPTDAFPTYEPAPTSAPPLPDPIVKKIAEDALARKKEEEENTITLPDQGDFKDIKVPKGPVIGPGAEYA